ncbi:DNA alkylation repair protein [Variovorax dokdonensis]|uniref:DNA alkylation repair protein n=1 Tax=Variovorax dokdonensis TaxID=344883 RepID=A0ABT7N5I1_9BURK|nr:DNA alkylation repair protein [Variovorax dokdonensis]MDM0043188.1 DNA alkylation repair protein [Variovorax dokdonensis]
MASRAVEHLLARKGAFRIALIPAEVLDALNDGLIETVNLNEFLAIDLSRLAPGVARDVGLDPSDERLGDALAMLDAFKPMQRHGHVARALYEMVRTQADAASRDAIAHRLATHRSDVARAWATQWIAFSGLLLAARLSAVRRFAADPHFGVREFAWMALRDAVIAAPDAAIDALLPLACDGDPNIRRFACELTRPRGVWCAPIADFRNEPWRAQDLLELLRSDPSRYVQDSVANWLNDASKSQAAWVVQLCERWGIESASPATAYIVRRAMRTLNKSAGPGV